MSKQKVVIILMLVVALMVSNIGILFGQSHLNGDDIEEVYIIPTFNLLGINSKREASMVFTGDVSFGTPYGRKSSRFHKAFKENEEDLSYFFKGVESVTKEADGVFINLENPFTNSQNYTDKIWTYKAHSNSYVKFLKDNNIKWANIINNHSHDYKQKGLDDTIKLLEEKNILPVGTNKSNSTSNEIPSVKVDRKEIIDINGIKVGVAGYLGFYSNSVSHSKLKEDIEYLKENSDYVVINFHWGGQRTQSITGRQKQLGRLSIDYGADLIIGNHPHVLQKIEEYKGKKIYYSLGNLFFVHQYSVKSKNTDSLLVELNLTKTGDKVKSNIREIPINWAGSKNTNIFKPYIK